MTVYIVGAGPGDPDLITLRGANLLASAEVVLYDRLAASVLHLARSSAELVDVGKARGHAPVPQEAINSLLIERGRSHDCVVRLKGGDPSVFARVREETAALSAARIPYEIVPGVSAVLAAPAAAGFPLTARGISQSFTVISGHEDPATVPASRWRAMAKLGGTIVVMMGAAHIEEIAQSLIAAGVPSSMPAAAVRAGPTGLQRVSLRSLGELRADNPPPVTFVIGSVVARAAATGSPGLPAPQREVRSA